jgi:hypothetical protein
MAVWAKKEFRVPLPPGITSTYTAESHDKMRIDNGKKN